jgi:hypothetical protein
MASRKQSSFDNQNSDEMGVKDSLVTHSPNQKDPYRAQGSDFPLKKVSAAHGQSEDAPGENNKLVTLSTNQESPRDTENKGGEADSMTTSRGNIAANFKVSRNSGESGVAPVDPGNEYSVNLSTGRIECSGYKPTRVKEVAEDEVSIG